VKYSKSHYSSRVYKIPELRFEDQRLSSFSGLVVVQAFFAGLGLRRRLRECFQHINTDAVVGFHVVAMVLIVHVLIGYRRLREMDRYKDDPIVARLIGVKRLPEVSTVSRRLKQVDSKAVDELRAMSRRMVLEPLSAMGLRQVTVDFDGSVLSTGRFAEGTAVGFNKRKKGARSYYPLFATIAQTGQVLDLHHRPGNVHDSNGAGQFISGCIATVCEALPSVRMESRLDSAFFSDEIVDMLDTSSVEFTISAPFERFAELKTMIESRKRWRRLDRRWSYFELQWSPDCWTNDYRFIVIRQKVKKQRKGPVQLDLFVPYQYGYEFKVIVTNKRSSARNVLRFHNGRGAQENIFGELKSQCQMDYIPVRSLCGNQVYLLCSILAHNLMRTLQMQILTPHRRARENRAPLWNFEEVKTIRQHLIQRAGRLTRPNGKLRLTMSGNEATKTTIETYLNALQDAA
jgi:hypothetical protein